MSIAAQKVLSDAKALSPDEMRELLRDIEEILEDMDDVADAQRVREQIARGEMDTVSLDEVMQKLGITNADLQD
jgi:predicted DNA-binding protein